MDNPLGVYYAFLATSDEVDWLACLRRTKAAGLSILEVSAPRMHALGDRVQGEIADAAAALGIGLTFATALTPDADVSDPDPALRAAGVERLRGDVRLVHAMGGTALGGVLTGVSKHFPPGVEHTRGEAAHRAAVALREVAELAQALHVTLGVEVVNRFETPLVNTCAEGLAVTETVGSPALGVHLDTFHMNIEEARLGDAIRLAGKRLSHFHACENNRALPGRGHIDWAEVFAALRAVDYRGPIVMEALPGPNGSVAGRLNIWRRLAGDVDAELAEATCFLHERMEDSHAV